MERVCGQVVTVAGMGLSRFERLLVGTVWSLAWESGTVAVRGIGKVGSVAGVSALRDLTGVGVGWTGLVGESTLRGVTGTGGSSLELTVPCRTDINCLSAWTWLSHKGARGELGEGCCKAWVISAILALM